MYKTLLFLILNIRSLEFVWDLGFIVPAEVKQFHIDY